MIIHTGVIKTGLPLKQGNSILRFLIDHSKKILCRKPIWALKLAL